MIDDILDKAVEPKRPSFKRAKPEAPKEEITATVAPAIVVEPVKEMQEPTPTTTTLPNRLQEVASMIEVKNYVHSLINVNFTLDKSKMKELQSVNLLLDIKIVDLILSPEFKSFVNFKDAEKANKEAAWNNSVKQS